MFKSLVRSAALVVALLSSSQSSFGSVIESEGFFQQFKGGALLVTGALPGASSDADVESFLSLPTGDLDAYFGSDITNGSALKSMWSFSAGDSFALDWLLLNLAGGFSSALVTLDGQIFSELASTSTPGGLSGSFSWVAPSDMTATFGLAVVVKNTTPVTVLGAGNFSYVAAPTPALSVVSVPEPGTLLLLGVGLLGLVGLRRRNRV